MSLAVRTIDETASCDKFFLVDGLHLGKTLHLADLDIAILQPAPKTDRHLFPLDLRLTFSWNSLSEGRALKSEKTG
jgi:hypothetical protein